MPSSISIRDIAIQKEQNDIVLATFGRGFYVLDNYSLIQTIKDEDLKKNTIFNIKDGLVFKESRPYGHKGKSFQGEAFYTAKNPPVGATFNLFIKDDYKSIKEKRIEIEKKKLKNNEELIYPSYDSIRLEDNEIAPLLFLVITDEQNNEIKKLKLNFKKGMQSTVWDGTYEVSSPINFNTPDLENPYYEADQGHEALPGKYFAQIIKVINDKKEILCEKVSFQIKTMHQGSLPAKDILKQMQLNNQIAEFRRIVLGSADYVNHLKNRIKYLKLGITKSGTGLLGLVSEMSILENQTKELELKLDGDVSLAKREFEIVPGFVGDLENMISSTWSQSYGSTGTLEEKYNELKTSFLPIYKKIKELKFLTEQFELKAENLKMPATYGRLPEF
jgi:hypothetical protein